MKSYLLAVIGGGASGMIAAITAAKSLPGERVLLIERGARVGRKLLATGNGRCNISNRYADVSRYHGNHPDFVQPALRSCSVEKIETFFSDLGLLFTEEENGKLFPMSLQAAAAVDVLRLELERLKVEIRTETELTAFRRDKNGFLLTLSGTEGEKKEYAEKIILACGGEASPGLGGYTGGYKLLQSAGHHVTARAPGIVQLRADMTGLKGLSGSKFEVELTLSEDGKTVRKEKGELLFTDYGVSGPPVLLLSESAVRMMMYGKRPILTVDFLPEVNFALLKEELVRRKQLHPEKRLEDYFTGFIPKRLGQCIFKTAGAAPLSRLSGSLTDREIKETASLLKAFPIHITEDNGLKNAQVTIGGADTSEFFSDTLQSKKMPGLFVTGELYDIDGDCGGYNLQWAWSSGMLAAQSAVKSLMRSARNGLYQKKNPH